MTDSDLDTWSDLIHSYFALQVASDVLQTFQKNVKIARHSKISCRKPKSKPAKHAKDHFKSSWAYSIYYGIYCIRNSEERQQETEKEQARKNKSSLQFFQIGQVSEDICRQLSDVVHTDVSMETKEQILTVSGFL